MFNKITIRIFFFLKIQKKKKNTEAVTQRCSVKMPFLKISQNSQENTFAWCPSPLPPSPQKKNFQGSRGGEGLNIFKLLFSWGVIYFFGGVTLNANYYIISNELMRIKQKEMKNNFFHILSSSSNLSNFQPLSLLRPRLTFNIILYFYIRFRFRFIRTY